MPSSRGFKALARHLVKDARILGANWACCCSGALHCRGLHGSPPAHQDAPTTIEEAVAGAAGNSAGEPLEGGSAGKEEEGGSGGKEEEGGSGGEGEDLGGREARGARDSDFDAYILKPWTYNLTEIPPDSTASRLSDKSKEAMYALHVKDPAQWTAARLAKEYRIREQRAHAILWLKELEKQEAEAKGEALDDDTLKWFENRFGTVEKAAKEQHVSIFPSAEVDAIEDEETRLNKLLEESRKEEAYKVEEFVQRMYFNKLQVSGKVAVKPEQRRYVVGPDGTRRPLNDVEKQYLQREKTRPRRRIVP